MAKRTRKRKSGCRSEKKTVFASSGITPEMLKCLIMFSISDGGNGGGGDCIVIRAPNAANQ